MSSYYGLALLALSSMSTLASAFPQNAGNLTLYGPDELNSQVSNTFLSCLNHTGTDYKLYVEELGTTIVLPPTNRTVDFETEDQALFECMIKVNHQMELAAEATIFHQDEHHDAISHKLATYEWLKSHGAQGKKPVGSRPPRTLGSAHPSTATLDSGNATMITPRQTLHYFTYCSDYSGCSSIDLEASFAGHCHTWNQAYTSVQFENTAQHEYLSMQIWPHHRCIKGNQRKFTINPGTLGSCQNRKTYSFQGTFSKCKFC